LNIFVKIALIFLAVLAVIIITGLIFFRILFPQPLSKEDTEKDFVKNMNSIMAVTNYLINAKYNDVYIPDIEDSGVVFASGYGDISIEDSQVVKAIKILLKRKGYSVISKKGNTIHFQRSTVFRNFGSGIAYSIDGSEPILQYLTKLEPLSEPNWYYYEEDFNEWDRQNK
jgi:hypothetical protein